MNNTTHRQTDLSRKNNPVTGASKGRFAVYAKEANVENPLASIVVGERPEPKVPNDAITPFTLAVPPGADPRGCHSQMKRGKL